MTELYLRLLDRVLTPVLLLLAAEIFLRGHNLPGGGFIAGLMAVAAFQLQILSRGAGEVRDTVGRYLQPGAGAGLFIAAFSAVLGLFGGTFFQGLWLNLYFGDAEIKLGTPLLFDLGVFITVVCFATSFLLGLSDRMNERNIDQLEERLALSELGEAGD